MRFVGESSGIEVELGRTEGRTYETAPGSLERVEREAEIGRAAETVARLTPRRTPPLLCSPRIVTRRDGAAFLPTYLLVNHAFYRPPYS